MDFALDKLLFKSIFLGAITCCVMPWFAAAELLNLNLLINIYPPCCWRAQALIAGLTSDF